MNTSGPNTASKRREVKGTRVSKAWSEDRISCPLAGGADVGGEQRIARWAALQLLYHKIYWILREQSEAHLKWKEQCRNVSANKEVQEKQRRNGKDPRNKDKTTYYHRNIKIILKIRIRKKCTINLKWKLRTVEWVRWWKTWVGIYEKRLSMSLLGLHVWVPESNPEVMWPRVASWFLKP